MPERFLVRPARLSDVCRIAEVHVRSWQAAYAGLIPDSTLTKLSIEEKERFWREALSRGSGSTLVLVNENLLIGWASFGPARHLEYRRIHHHELCGLYLLATHWGRGFGGQLYRETERCIQRTEAKGVMLWVFEGNNRGRRFYEAFGYRLEEGKRDEKVFEGVRVGVVCYRKALAAAAQSPGDI